MDSAQFWIQVVATLLIACTFLVYVLQLKAMRSASTAQNILAVLNYLQEPAVRDARRRVLVELSEKPLTAWTADDRSAASLVYSTYDAAGMLIRSGLVPKDLFITNWGHSILDCHRILTPFLTELNQVAPGAQYGGSLKWLSDEAQQLGMSKTGGNQPGGSAATSNK